MTTPSAESDREIIARTIYEYSYSGEGSSPDLADAVLLALRQRGRLAVDGNAHDAINRQQWTAANNRAEELQAMLNKAWAERDALRAERADERAYRRIAESNCAMHLNRAEAAEKERDEAIKRETVAFLHSVEDVRTIANQRIADLEEKLAAAEKERDNQFWFKAHEESQAKLAAAQAEAGRMRGSLAALVGSYDWRRLDKGIGTDTEDGRRWLAARAALSPGDAGTAVVRDPNRCACCGWILQEDLANGCVRGNCSMRPMPETMYDAERFAKEAGTGAT